MGFNSVFKGLIPCSLVALLSHDSSRQRHTWI